MNNTGPGSEGSRFERRLLLAAFFVFLLALGLRLAHVGFLQRELSETHLFSTGRVDAAFHLREARAILEDDPLLRDRVHWKGPGYSYFLAGLMLTLGRDPGAFRWFLSVLGALNCAALVLLARRFLGRRGAVLAGLLAALNGTILLFDAELFFPTLLISLNLAMLGLLLRPGLAATVSAGLLAGLAALVHPPYLLAAAAVTPWVARRGWRHATGFALLVALTVAPVTLKNLIARGQPTLISWSGGINFYIGNQPAYDQTSGQGTPAWERTLETTADAGISGETARDRWYYGLALRQMADDPGTALRLLLLKLRVFLSPVEIANNFRLYELRDYSPVLRATLGHAGSLWWPFGLWAALAWPGAVLLARRRVDGQGLILLWALALSVACVLFFNTARYRVPLVFFGSIWAAAWLEAGWRLADRRRWLPLAAGVAATALVGAITAAMALPQRSLPLPIAFTEAVVLEQRGRIRDATRMHERVCDEHPRDAGLLLSAADYFLRHGRHEEGRGYLRRVLALRGLQPDHRSNALEGLGDSYLATGRLNEAEVAYRSAIEVGVDRTTWMGEPYFQLSLGPVTECRLRIALAEIEFRRGHQREAGSILADVDETCGFHGRIAERRKRLPESPSIDP